MDEKGYIKFNCELVKCEPLPLSKLRTINSVRKRLYGLGLIGRYENGIGFGNISFRISDSNQFIITGSATGGIKDLSNEHYTTVISYNFERNKLKCKGPIAASSESLTHAALYESDSRINGIIHVHNKELWSRLLGKVPTTSKDVAYGTPEMAYEIKRLFRETSNIMEKGIVAMEGHEEGIISFGRSLDEALTVLLNYFNES